MVVLIANYFFQIYYITIEYNNLITEVMYISCGLGRLDLSHFDQEHFERAEVCRGIPTGAMPGLTLLLHNEHRKHGMGILIQIFRTSRQQLQYHYTFRRMELLASK